MKNSIKQAAFTCILSYILLFASAVAIIIIIKLLTGYFPSVILFTLVLLTSGFFAIHPVFVLVPPVLAFSVMVFLSKVPFNTKFAAGAGAASYYVLIELIYLLSGTGDLPTEVAVPWISWAFIMGFLSSLIVVKLKL